MMKLVCLEFEGMLSNISRMLKKYFQMQREPVPPQARTNPNLLQCITMSRDCQWSGEMVATSLKGWQEV